MTDAIARARDLLHLSRTYPDGSFTIPAGDVVAICTALLAADERVRSLEATLEATVFRDQVEFDREMDAVDERMRQAVEAEREACAKVCADIAHEVGRPGSQLAGFEQLVAEQCVNAIRARGQAKGE